MTAALAAVTSVSLAGCTIVTPDARDRVGSKAFMRRADSALAAHPNTLKPASCTQAAGAQRTVSSAERTADMDALSLPTWRSGDVGVTTPLSDGRVLWVFGDTTRASGVTPRMVDNSMLVSTGRCFAEVATPGGGSVMGALTHDRACWPTSALTIPAGRRDLVVVGCSRVERGTGKDGLYDFSYRGASMAVFAVAKDGAPQRVTTVDLTADNADQEQINWGSALVGDGDWIYVYGSQQPKGSAGKGAYVARARLAQLGDHGSWQFWNGTRFTRGAAPAQPFLPASQGVSQTYSVVRRGGGFVLVSKQGGEFGANIGLWTAEHPEGPWRGYRAVPQSYSLGGGVVAYQPLAHPELPTPSGTFLLSMSRNTENFADLLRDPRKGRPMFLEVPGP